jgi:cytoskeletal protein CcmA (bactofilin family)
MPMNPTNSTVLGRSVVLHGELTGNEDLLIEGQFDGSVHLEDNCLTVGAGGQVKAEIHARQVIIHGKVTGNISAREKVEIRKTGHVLGDLTTAGVAIEDGAYFKGSIEILREENLAPARASAASSGGGDGSSLG